MSKSTKRMKQMTGDDLDYGRRRDMVVKTRENEEEQYDLCSDE